MPFFALIPIGLKIGALVAALGGLAWLVDEIGDRREARVRAEYAEQIRVANKNAAEAETKWRSQYEADSAARGQTLTEILTNIKPGCIASPELVIKLNAINPRKR